MNREDIIRELIRQKNMSIKSFAEYADIPYTTLYSILERGIGKAAVDNVIKVCKALNITVEDLEKMASETESETVETIAAHAIEDLTEEEQQKLIEYAKFIKSQRKMDEK